MVFGTIPVSGDDDDRLRWNNAVDGRQVHLRQDNRGTTRAVLAFDRTENMTTLSLEEAMGRISGRYAGAGWQTERVLEGFATSSDVYLDYLTHVRMPTWHRGRVVVTGGAAWCVTPLGGGGASLALTAGYVLAAYVAGAREDQLDRALTQFERWTRPLVDTVQKLPLGTHQLAYPQTWAGLKVRGLVMKALTSAPLRGFT